MNEQVPGLKPGAHGVGAQAALAATDDGSETSDPEDSQQEIVAAVVESLKTKHFNGKGKYKKYDKYDKDKRNGNNKPTPGPQDVVFTFISSIDDPGLDYACALGAAGDLTTPHYDCDTDDAAVVLSASNEQMLSDIAVSRAGELILDSAASRHVVFDERLLEEIQDCNPFHIYSATGHHTLVKKVGLLRFSPNVCISNVYLVPRATHNLISLGRLLDGGAQVGDVTREVFTVYANIPKTKNRVWLKFKRDSSGIYKMGLPDSIKIKIKKYRSLLYRPPNHISDDESEPDNQSKAKATSHIADGTKEASSSHSTTSSTTSTFIPPTNSGRTIPKKPFKPHPGRIEQANLAMAFTEGPEPPSHAASPNEVALQFHFKETNTAKLWHTRLGHQNISVLTEMNKVHNLGISDSTLKEFANCQCDTCIIAKGRRTKVGNIRALRHHAPRIGYRVHSDLFGPVSAWDGHHKNRILTTVGGKLYGLVIVEEFSRTVFVKLLKFKDDATDELIAVIEQIETITGSKLIHSTSDGGGEFINNQFKNYCEQKGIQLNYTTANSPFHNGIAERMNGVLLEMARAMMIHASAPLDLWGEAITYSAFIHNNSVQSSIANQIPFNLLLGSSYPAEKMRVFGCDAYIYLDESVRGKFQDKFRRGIFVGYDTTQNGFRIYDPETRRVTVSRNVKLIENSFNFIRNGVEEEDRYIGNTVIVIPRSANDTTDSADVDQSETQFRNTNRNRCR